MFVRKAIQSDFEDLWPLLEGMGKTSDKADVKERFLQIVEAHNHFMPVAIVDNKLVGYGWAQDFGFHLRLNQKTSRMHDLYVKEDSRGNGVAHALFEEIKHWAWQNETKWLQWNASKDSVAFYKKIGLSPLAYDEDTPEFEVEF